MVFINLLLAILFEVAGTTSMKLSHGFAEVGPSFFIVVFYSLSFIFLTLSLKHLEVGLAYAVWAGLGTFLIALIGIIYFHEPLTFIKASSLFLIVAGIIGFKLE